MISEKVFEQYQRFKRLKNELDSVCSNLQHCELDIDFNSLRNSINIIFQQLQRKIDQSMVKEKK